MKLEVQLLSPDVPVPVYQTSGSVAFDLTNQSGIYVTIRPGETVLIRTGLKVKVPEHYAGFVSSRSGISLKRGFRVGNAPGIIDSDYRGEVGVIAANDSNSTIFIDKGERIAQFTVVPIIRCNIDVVESFDVEIDNERGENGFGSTGSGC